MHNRPVQDMGNYQEYLKRLPQPLRELEITPIRQHTFGNPFKVNKVWLDNSNISDKYDYDGNTNWFNDFIEQQNVYLILLTMSLFNG